MICEKTGATIWLNDLECYVRGDVYPFGHDLLIRVNNRSRTKEPVPIVHYTVNRVIRWFDGEEAQTGTIIATDFRYHGYEGIKP